MKGLIFFGHGAKDQRWREPFDKLAALWSERDPQIPVEVAFLERMEPNLVEAVGKLKARGVNEVHVLPVFFGQGGHLREDFPVLLDEVKQKYPQIRLSTQPAVGENLEVLQAILGMAAKSVA